MKKNLLFSLVFLFILSSFCKAQTFYGMTSEGGADSTGAIISFNVATNEESVVWNFGSGKDGAKPWGTLVYNAGNGLFYGLTSYGGDNNLGAIISFNPSTNKDSVLWSFAGYPADGALPFGDLVYDANNGLFYGMTYGVAPII